ncbi:MAG TPA: hypothetical protein PLZ77_08790 [Lachnospiraceae bacterium]|nr:hypothetical protein [Lachnospiraceae bacterium]HPF30180.1 hypothetical protein [Lachnospiraceae bacterium]
MERQTKTTPRQIAAWIGIIFLVVLILCTLIVACISFPGKEKVLIALSLCDIVVPVFMWFCLHLARNNRVQSDVSENDGDTAQ